MENLKIRKSFEVLKYVLFFVSAVVGVLLFSYRTSPLYPLYIDGDSCIFLTVGKAWAEGKCIPYRDLFDHKGPIIFLIDAIGWKMTSSTLGIVIIQVFCIFLDEIFCFKIISLGFSHIKSLCLSALLPLLIYYNWDGGNMTEEFILPLLFLSYYYMLKWVLGITHDNKEANHNSWWGFLYGITFSFAVMTRITNAAGLCVGVAFIAVYLMKSKLWKNLMFNALLFIFGTGLLIVPFCIYFNSKNVLYDMWYATLLYNFSYTTTTGSLIPQKVVLKLCFLGLTCVLICIFKLFIAKKDDRKVFMFWLLVSFFSVALNSTLNFYPHYSLVFLPLFYIGLYLFSIHDNKSEKNNNMFLRNAWISFVCVMLLISVKNIYETYFTMNIKIFTEKRETFYQTMISQIPEDEKNSVIAFDCPTSLYLDNDITPAFKYYILQSWQSEHSKEYRGNIINQFKSKQIKWVLISSESSFLDVLNDQYTLVSSSDSNDYYLYNLVV